MNHQQETMPNKACIDQSTCLASRHQHTRICVSITLRDLFVTCIIVWIDVTLGCQLKLPPAPPGVNDSQYYDTARVIHHGRDSACHIRLWPESGLVICLQRLLVFWCTNLHYPLATLLIVGPRVADLTLRGKLRSWEIPAMRSELKVNAKDNTTLFCSPPLGARYDAQCTN